MQQGHCQRKTGIARPLLRGRLSRRFPPLSFRLCLRERLSRRFPPSSFRLCLRGHLSRRFPPPSSRQLLRGRLSRRFPPSSFRLCLREHLSRRFPPHRPASSSASAFPVDFKPVCARENVGGVIQGLLRKARVDDGISLLRCLQRVYLGVLLQFCRHICRKTPYSTTELQPEACTDMSDRKSVGPSHQGIKPESRFFVILKKLGSLW